MMRAMSEPGGSFRETAIRPPAVAGVFYPAEPNVCRDLGATYLQAGGEIPQAGSGRVWMGGVVPHAAWVCSGAIAGQTIATLSAGRSAVEVVVVFGAVHTPLPLAKAALDSHGRWQSPARQVLIPAEVIRRLHERAAVFFVEDDRFHAREHAVEVELPLIQLAWPQAALLPVQVPAIDAAIEIGIHTARAVSASGLKAVYLASSDFTHYGPNYGFTPSGLGLSALRWALDNDGRMLRVITDFIPERVVPEANHRLNACGPGAIAAMMAACREMGASQAIVLRHSNSYQILHALGLQSSDNAVGYASVVVG